MTRMTARFGRSDQNGKKRYAEPASASSDAPQVYCFYRHSDGPLLLIHSLPGFEHRPLDPVRRLDPPADESDRIGDARSRSYMKRQNDNFGSEMVAAFGELEIQV